MLYYARKIWVFTILTLTLKKYSKKLPKSDPHVNYFLSNVTFEISTADFYQLEIPILFSTKYRRKFYGELLSKCNYLMSF